MNQQEHVEMLIEKSKSQRKKADTIQYAYEKYFKSGLDSDFSILISSLDSYCISWVRKQLWKTGCYSEENEFSAMQEGRLATWKVVLEDKTTNTIRDDFAYYAFGVYKHKVLDEIRKISSARKKAETVSINDTIGSSELTFEDKIPPVQFGEEDAKEEQRILFERIFFIYCKSFLESSTFPPRCLALYYARVLPHMLGAIPDGKATSAKWAYDRIGRRKVEQLKSDSESYIQKEVDRSLRWCREFVQQLCDEVSINGKSIILKELVFIDGYSKEKIEDWADYMHRACTKKSMEIILKDTCLLELAKEYISQSDTLYKLIGRGQAR